MTGSVSQRSSDIIATFIPTLGGAGAEKVTLTLTTGLVAAGRKVDFIVGHRTGPFVNSVPRGCNLVDLGGRRVRQSILPLAKYLRKAKPRVIISQLDFTNAAVGFAALLSRTGTPVVSVEHNIPQQMDHTHGLRRWLIRQMYLKAAKVVAVSQGVASSVEEHYRLPQSKVSVIHNGVVDESLERRAKEPVPHPWLKDNPTIPVFLTVGRLHHQKAYDVLLDAMALVVKRREARLILLGQGELLGALNAQVDRLGLRNHVDFGGFQLNPYPFFRTASCFVLSSNFEGLPTVIIEALACGCPVVSTDCHSGPADILDREGLGFLVPMRNPAALADAMCKALDTKFDREKLRARAADFSVEACAKNYLRLIDSL